MQSYWPEFLTVALVHLLAVASPGPKLKNKKSLQISVYPEIPTFPNLVATVGHKT